VARLGAYHRAGNGESVSCRQPWGTYKARQATVVSEHATAEEAVAEGSPAARDSEWRSPTFIAKGRRWAMNITVCGSTFRVTTEADLLRLLVALRILQALPRRKAA